MSTKIQTTKKIIPQIYAWSTPDIPKYKNWLKIGYTTRDPKKRVAEQGSQLDIKKNIEWHYEARFLNGKGYFDDHAFHDFLTRVKKIPRESGSEWFDYTPDPRKSRKDFSEFVMQDFDYSDEINHQNYQLRAEQNDAVTKTVEYFKTHVDSEFLWNAKPRFGKTLSSYDLIRKLDAINVLIVTNRPAIANSWFDDYEKFIAWQTKYLFVSDSESLKDRRVRSRQEYLANLKADSRQIAFVSLQDLKGSEYFGGEFDKLKWVADINWDLLIIDEAHEGVDTFKTDKALNLLNRKHTLHLSGTPFKALASDKFTEEQVFTWSYEDEQTAKKEWNEDKDGYNPYEALPTLNLFTYQLSSMMTDKVNKGAQLEHEEVPYYFDLNEFFSVDEYGKFQYEKEVVKFLDSLTTNEKYPFSTVELRDELKHTFWLLNRVASVKALAKLLKKHPVFSEYEIVIAAGDGRDEAEDVKKNEASLEKVNKAISENDKTITLSVGQLTTGITVKPWTAVLMLSDIKSPSLYMQAAFRAQNAYQVEDENGELKRKENAYIFDFAPERTLILFDEFANNLKTSTSNGSGTSEDRKKNITTLLNFLPVIGEDENGRMIELDAEQVLTIPHQLKAQEVVKHGFMSNFLFANISRIFQAPQIVFDTINQLEPAKEEKKHLKNGEHPNITIDEDGKVQPSNEIVINKTDALFTDEKRVQIENVVHNVVEEVSEPMSTKATEKFIKNIAETVAETATPDLTTLKTQFEDSKKSDVNRIQKTIETKVAEAVRTDALDFDKKQAELKREVEQKIDEAVTEAQILEIREQEQVDLTSIFADYQAKVQETVTYQVAEAQKEAVKEQEKRQDERKKNSVENDVRDHLRGFSRTIPSFIMAYGDENLTLANFDDYTPDDVFLEVTGIEESQFRFLRDGGDYEDPKTGETKHFDGHLFDEMVFNQSIQEFLALKEKLGDYFDESHDEDIFDYIPLQKTNQKFTPRKYVKLMVDSLESENPEIFSDSTTTFFDPYVKSGLYLTEVAKKLFHNQQIIAEFPDDDERMKHILEHQVYGAAPTQIIYNIAKHFVYGKFADVDDGHLVCHDFAPDAKDGTMAVKITEIFGGNTK